MGDTWAFVEADIERWPSKSDLAEMFRKDGYLVYEGRYSVRLDDFDSFQFRELGGDLGPGCVTADNE
ncbi:MAG: hypothetical protein AAGE03_17760 [Pseudomonadota bacterium]